MWILYALFSAVFASLTSIFAKIGIENVNSNLATAIRTTVVLIMAWVVVFVGNTMSATNINVSASIQNISTKSWIFLIISGISTGVSWLLYFKALQIGNVSVVVPIDKLSIVISIVLAFFILGEPFSIKSVIGCILITLGSLILVL